MHNRTAQLILALVLCVSLLCPVFSVAEAEDTVDYLAPYDEPITITWSVPTSAVQQFFNGDTYEDNAWSRLIKERLNINIEVAFSADNSTDIYRNKCNTVIATGDLPDIIKWPTITQYRQAQEEGLLADLEDVWEKYASPELKAYREQYPDSFNAVSVDGRLFGFPYMEDNFHNAAFLWIRDDWLKNLNAEPPKTIDEMVALARRFTFEDPDGNGKNDTYGLGLQGLVATNNVGTLEGFAGAFGAPGHNDTGVFYRDKEGKMTFGWIQPGMKKCLEIVRDMYKEGLIDPEFTALNTSTMETQVTNGTIGMMYHMNWGTWHPFNYSYQADGVITRPYPIPLAEGYEPLMGINSNEIGDFYTCVSANCEHPEALIKILNLYEEVVMRGSAETFDTYWANEQYRLSPAYIGIPTELFAPVIHAALEAGTGDGLTGTAAEYYKYVTGFEDGSMADNTNAYGTWGQMFIDGYGGSMKIALDYKDKGWLVQNVLASEMPDIWLQNSSVLADMIETSFVDIIVGNKDLDYFDEFVKNWLAAGGQETLDWLDAKYPAK
jgi:putative aldouronate transport system substrate-binding protein